MGFDTVLTQFATKMQQTKDSVRGFVTVNSWK